MHKKKFLYIILFLSYVFFSFTLFPFYNIEAAIPYLIISGVGAWLFGTHNGLILILCSMPYNCFLLEHYADIITIYQGKAIGHIVPIVIVFVVGTLKKMRDEAEQLSVHLEYLVKDRTAELDKLTRQLISDDESFRQSIGREIHDNLGQNLTGLLLYCSSVHEELVDAQSPLTHISSDLVYCAQNSLNLARTVSRTLFPLKMLETGLYAAIDELTSFFVKTTNISFDFQTNGHDDDFTNDTAVHLYRIAHESILNIIHKDTPDAIRIRLDSDKTQCSLTIDVDGCKDTQILFKDTFFDLMRYRAKLAGATLNASNPSDNLIYIELITPLSECLVQECNDKPT